MVRRKTVVKIISFFGLMLLLFANSFLRLPGNTSTALAAPASGNKETVLTVPARALTFVPFHFGKSLGIYKQEGIDLNIVRMKTNLVSSGLVSGSVQYGVPLSNFVRGAAAGMPIKLLMTVEDRIVYDFVTAKDITSFNQLKGHPIGITARNGNLHLTAIAVLKGNGLSKNDVTFVSYPGLREKIQALQAGAIKGGIFPPPLNIRLSKKGFPTIAHGAEYYNGAAQGLATSDKYLQENRPAVVAMVRATLRTMRYIGEHPAETKAFIEKHLKVDTELAEKLYDYLVRQISKDGKITREWVQERLDEMKELGGTPKVSDPQKIIDLGPLKEARTSLKR